MRKWIIVLLVLGAAITAWIFKGRFAVEGGRAPWAVINGRLDVLREALAAGIDDKEKDLALSRAVQRGNAEATKLLLTAGAKPNPLAKGYCLLGTAVLYGRTKTVQALLEGGADPRLCEKQDSLVADFIAHNFDGAPEPELIGMLKLLIERSENADTPDKWDAALKIAKEKKLTQVVAYLQDPEGAVVPDAKNAPKLALLGGHMKLGRDGLKQVCQGEGISDLPAYQKQEGMLSPMVAFERRFEDFFFPGQVLPRYWTSWDDMSHTQVVACVHAADKQVVKECHYEGKGGGVRIYDVTYEMVLREARTGKELAKKSVSLKSSARDCPSIKFGRDQEGVYPSYADELAAFAGPMIGLPLNAPASTPPDSPH